MKKGISIGIITAIVAIAGILCLVVQYKKMNKYFPRKK